MSLSFSLIGTLPFYCWSALLGKVNVTISAITVTIIIIIHGKGLSSSATSGADAVIALEIRLHMPTAVDRLSRGKVLGSEKLAW